MSEYGNLLDKARFYLDQHNISFSDIALISNLGLRSKKNHILVLSGFNVFILTQKKVSKNITKKYDKSIFDISSICLNESKNIVIQFEKSKNSSELKLQFRNENPQELIKSILDHTNRLLTPYEFKKIKIDGILIEHLAPHTSHSVLTRLNLLLNQNEVEVPTKLLKKVARHLYTHLHSFIFSKFRCMKQFFPIFFPCISILQYVNQIDIMSRRAFKLMFKQMECFDNILHVRIRGLDSENLKILIDKSKEINAVSFHDRIVQTFDFIAALMENRVNSIGFDSALDENSFQSFLQLPSFQNLQYFRVSNLANLNFTSCATKFNKLSVLSLTSCNLEVGNVLEKLISNHVTLLTKIDLSGNLGKGFRECLTKHQKHLQNFTQSKHSRTLSTFDKNRFPSGYRNNDTTDVKIALPIQLDVLFVNDVEWDLDQLIFFMSLCSNSQVTNLSLNNITFIGDNKQDQIDQSKESTNQTNTTTNNTYKNHHHYNNSHNDDSYNDFEEEEESSENLGQSEDNINYKNLNPIESNTSCWSTFFSNIPQQMQSLKTLSWNSNRINNNFLNFLSRSPKLTEVSFCGCNCSDIAYIETLLTRIKIQRLNLKQIRFNNQFIYFRQFKNFLLHLPNLKSLKKLDLSHNNIDDECFEILSESLLNANLDFIALDDSNVSTYDILMKFYQKLEQTKDRQLKISFPILDIQRLDIPQSQVDELIERSYNISKPLSERTIDSHKYLPDVYYLRLDNNFPQFLLKNDPEKEEQSRIRSTATQPSIQFLSSSAKNHKINNNSRRGSTRIINNITDDSDTDVKFDIGIDLDENNNNNIKSNEKNDNSNDNNNNYTQINDDTHTNKIKNRNSDDSEDNRNNENTHRTKVIKITNNSSKFKSKRNINPSINDDSYSYSADDEGNPTINFKQSQLKRSSTNQTKFDSNDKDSSKIKANRDNDNNSNSNSINRRRSLDNNENSARKNDDNSNSNSINRHKNFDTHENNYRNNDDNSNSINANHHRNINDHESNNNNYNNDDNNDNEKLSNSIRNNNNNNGNDDNNVKRRKNHNNSNRSSQNMNNNDNNLSRSMPTSPQRRRSLAYAQNDDMNNYNYPRSPRRNTDFMDFSPNSEKRHWSKHECENWKPRVLPIPAKIDNTVIMMNYNKEFSLNKLLNQMAKK